LEDVLGNPVAGESWEGFVFETMIAAAPEGTQANFHRTAVGAEIDLLLTLPGGALWAIEVKRSLAPTLERGFYQACSDLTPQRRIAIQPGSECYPLREGIEVMPLQIASAVPGKTGH
jgi:predicted AAA+ superfamily ATPase